MLARSPENETFISPYEIVSMKNRKNSVVVTSNDDGSGLIETYNKYGNRVTSLGITQNQDGVVLCDKYGDFGNSVVGEK